MNQSMTYDVLLRGVEAVERDDGTYGVTIITDEGTPRTVILDRARITVTPKYDLRPGDIWQDSAGDLGQVADNGWLVLTPGHDSYGQITHYGWMSKPLTPIYTPRDEAAG